MAFRPDSGHKRRNSGVANDCSGELHSNVDKFESDSANGTLC